MTVLSIDFETRAVVDLRKTGVYPYAEHPLTDIWCMAWAFDDEEPVIWTPGEPLPRDIRRHISEEGEIRAWNAAFERIIWDRIMVRTYGAPGVFLDQWVCSAAEAAAMSLPRSLDQCAAVCGITQQKDKDGYGLMMRMTRPRAYKNGVYTWWDDDDRKARLFEYCKQDVRVERALTKALRRLTPQERELYKMDQRMNDRGIRVDLELVTAAQEIVQEGMDRANAALEQLTDGEVTEVTKVGRIKTWVSGLGLEVESLDKPSIRDLLESDLDPTIRQVLEIRQEAGKSSNSKLKSMVSAAGTDSRARGLLLYHAASTGRWAGRLIQPQNFPRGSWKYDTLEDLIELVMGREFDNLSLIANPLEVISAMLRLMLTAEPGHELVSADYSGIEARGLNWVAGQDDILAMFARGEDVYSYNAARLTKTEYIPGKKHPHRQTGKFQELGCGFGMGAETAVTQAKDQYQVILTLEEAKEVVDSYRATHPMVKQFWRDSDNAAKLAVQEKGTVVPFGPKGNCKFLFAGSYLYLMLPSGRPLVYADPRVEVVKAPWKDKWGNAVWIESVTTKGMNQVTRRWERQKMYGGLWTENIVQAISRDIMAEGMLRVEAAGYPPVLSVHDEVVSEVLEGKGSLEEFMSLLSVVPEWAAGWPIATEGWRGFRYRK